MNLHTKKRNKFEQCNMHSNRLMESNEAQEFCGPKTKSKQTKTLNNLSIKHLAEWLGTRQLFGVCIRKHHHHMFWHHYSHSRQLCSSVLLLSWSSRTVGGFWKYSLQIAKITLSPHHLEKQNYHSSKANLSHSINLSRSNKSPLCIVNIHTRTRTHRFT